MDNYHIIPSKKRNMEHGMYRLNNAKVGDTWSIEGDVWMKVKDNLQSAGVWENLKKNYKFGVALLTSCPDNFFPV